MLLPLKARRRLRASLPETQDYPACPVLPVAAIEDPGNLRWMRIYATILLVSELLRCGLLALSLRVGPLRELLTYFTILPLLLLFAPFLWRVWRRCLFLLRRRTEGMRLDVPVAVLLAAILIGELAYFRLGETRGNWPPYSPTWPAFLAGPVIALLSGWLAMGEKQYRSHSGRLLLGLSLIWFLFPISLDLDALIPTWATNPIDNPLPFVPAALFSVVLYTLTAYGLASFFTGGYLEVVALALVLIPLWEWRKGRIRWVTAMTTIMTGFALAPFLHEWINHIFD